MKNRIATIFLGACLCHPLAAQSLNAIGSAFTGEFVPPAPRQPLPPADVIQRSSIRQGGRTITIEQVVPPEIPPAAAPAVAQPSPEEAARRHAAFLAGRMAHPVCLLSLSATVYDHKATLLRWRHGETQYQAWSNIDFEYLRGFGNFESGGTTYHLMMMIGNVSTKPRTTRTGVTVNAVVPDIPPLPDEPGFVLVAGDPSDSAAMNGIQELHDMYKGQHDQLIAAHERLLQYQAAAQAWAKANPPQPEDITVRFAPGPNTTAITAGGVTP
jgi:hypothetical protein